MILPDFDRNQTVRVPVGFRGLGYSVDFDHEIADGENSGRDEGASERCT